MRTHGFNPTEEDLKDMIRNVDTNSNGAIDFNEFIEMMVKRGNNVEEDVAHAAVPSRNLNRSLSFPDTEASPPVTVALPTQPLSRDEIQCRCQTFLLCFPTSLSCFIIIIK